MLLNKITTRSVLLVLIPVMMPIAPLAAAHQDDRGSTSKLRWLLVAGAGAVAAYFYGTCGTGAPDSATGLVPRDLPDATAGSSSLAPLSGLGQAQDSRDAKVWANLALLREIGIQVEADGDEPDVAAPDLVLHAQPETPGLAAFEFWNRGHRSNYVVGLNELVGQVADGSQEVMSLRNQAYFSGGAVNLQAGEAFTGVLQFYDQVTHLLRDTQRQPDAQRPAEVAQSLRDLADWSFGDQGLDDSGRPATPVRGAQLSARDLGLALADRLQSLENPGNALAASEEYERNARPRYVRMQVAMAEADRAAEAMRGTQPGE